ncbi:MAG: AI-2E family transporter [Deltaproteobacteria bacterium]|nr:AI-2E family transporter [Deltaproteobacteria bacterium]
MTQDPPKGDLTSPDLTGSGRSRSRETFFSWLRHTARLWGFLAFILVILVSFRQVILPFVLAILVTYMLAPILNRLCRLTLAGRCLPRFVWLIVMYAVLLGLIGLFVVLFVPRVTNDFKRIAGEAPHLVQKIKKSWLPNVEAWVERNFHEKVATPSPQAVAAKPRLRLRPLPGGGFEVEAKDLALQIKPTQDGRYLVSLPDAPSAEGDQGEVSRYLSALMTGSGVEVKALLTAGQRFIGGLLRAITTFILVFMISAFLLLDTDRILRFFGTLVPRKYAPDYDTLLLLIDSAMGGAIRGQLLICFVNGTLTGLGLMLIGVKYVVLLALLAGVLSLIPIFGSILSSIPIVIVALVSGTEGVDLLRGGMVLAWIIGIHLIEANLLNPKIIGTAAKIHPVIVIFAVVAGERTYGAMGALLAVPIVSAVQATFIYVRAKVRGELHLVADKKVQAVLEGDTSC